jgi:TRAP-type C4-dicarboxylate transport system permease small subunit
VERGHVRIDVLHARLPRPARAVLNWLAVASLAALAVFLAWYGWPVIVDTRTYNSAAATPWATPLIYPQSAWFAAMAAFALAAVVLAVRATVQLVRRDWATLDTTLQPKGAREELADELRSLEDR